jgi:transcriptional antiterminator RfaH
MTIVAPADGVTQRLRSLILRKIGVAHGRTLGMPYISKDVDTNPPDLLQSPPLNGGDRRWWTLYTRVRQEKALSRELLAWKIPFYLPLVKQTNLHGGRKRVGYLPLFSSYLFLFGTDDERVRALTTDRVAKWLPAPDPDELVRDLAQIQRLIQAEVPLTLESKLQPGTPVRVRTGVLAGIEGIVHARTKPTKLVVYVEMLNQGVSLEVDDFTLERLE